MKSRRKGPVGIVRVWHQGQMGSRYGSHGWSRQGKHGIRDRMGSWRTCLADVHPGLSEGAKAELRRIAWRTCDGQVNKVDPCDGRANKVDQRAKGGGREGSGASR